MGVSTPNSFLLQSGLFFFFLIGVWVGEDGCFGLLVLKKPGYDHGCCFQQILLLP